MTENKHLVRKVGEIDLDKLIAACEERSWLNPIFVHDDSPKTWEGGELPDILQEISEEFNVTQSRILCLPPLSTLDYHMDSNNRINIHILTNDYCFFIFDDVLYKFPADGSVYLTNTKVLHTAVNASYTHRFHLIGFTDVEFD